jgi:hypothetical protein
MGNLWPKIKWPLAVIAVATAIVVGILVIPQVIPSADGRVIGVISATFIMASLLWMLVRKFDPRGLQKMTDNIATIDTCFIVTGAIVAIWALVGEHFWDDLLLVGLTGLALAMALLLFALIVGPSSGSLPKPGSKRDVINRRIIDRVWGKLRVESGHNEAPSDRDYAYMFATYAASRLDDAEKQALINTVLASMDDAVQAAVLNESAPILGSQISSPEPGRTT